jgi:Rrf2 family transcriptional regulator, cysteine metabolism repressor
MMDLAAFGNTGAPVYLSDIAKRQGLSEKYLEHIFGALHKSGLIKAVRGRRGGYLLNRLPVDITVSQILTVLEGPCNNLVDCVTDVTACPKSDSCASRDIWTVLGSKIEETLSNITLAYAVEKQKEKSGKDALMYHI